MSDQHGGLRCAPPTLRWDVGEVSWLEALELRRLAEQSQLDQRKSSIERNKLGQFATPPALALAIARLAAGLWQARGDADAPVRFLDPSIGTGSFFAALLAAFPHGSIDEAQGVELDPAFARAAADLWGKLGLNIHQHDFTRLDPPPPGQQANLILANPPYVRHHHLSILEKRRLAQAVADRTGLKLSGLSSFYAYFLLLADAWLADGGLAVWLIPSEVLDVNYGEVLRSYLTHRVTLRLIHRFRPDDGQFGDALVTSAIVVFEKTPPLATNTVRMTLGGPIDQPEQIEVVPWRILEKARKWSGFAEENQPEWTSNGLVTLGDLFTIRRGIATGSNAFFILKRDEAARLDIPPRYLTPILPSPRHLHETVIEADAEGDPILDHALVLVDCDRPEAELDREAPGLSRYLALGRARGLPAGYLLSRRKPWYAQEKRSPALFLCTYMARPRPPRPPFRFFWNRSRATAPNVFLMLAPKGPLKAILEAHPDRISTLFDRLQAIPARQIIREGRVYGGGLHKIEPRELAALPASEIVAGWF